MYHNYSSHPNPRVPQQLHVRRATRLHLQHTQNLEPSADLQARYQNEKMDSGTPTMFGIYAAADFTWGLPETAALGRVIGRQEPSSHPTTPHLTPPPESPMPDMVSPSSINANSGMNACYGLAAVLLPQRPPTMMYAGSSNVWQRPMPRKIPRAPIGDGQTVTMHWLRADSIWAQAQVLVTDQIHNSMTSLWPTNLRLDINPVGIGTVDVQKWIHKNHAPVSRIKCASGPDNRDFIDLVESLRNCGGYATAGWEDRGSYQTRLLLAPLFMDLLCAAFPANGIPKPPKPQSHVLDLMKRPVASNSLTSGSTPLPDPGVMSTFPEGGARDGALIPQRAQPQPWKRPEADHPLLNTMEPMQVDPNLFVPCNQATMFSPVRATLSPHVQLGQFPQAPPQQSNAQHSQQVATLTMLSGSQPDCRPTDAGIIGWVPVADTSHDLSFNSGLWSYIDENETTDTDTNAGINDVFGAVDAIDRVRA